MAALNGRVILTVGGRRIATKESSARINIGGVEREPEVADDGSVHHRAKGIPGQIDVEILVPRGLKVKDIQDIEDTTIVAQADNGNTYVYRNAFTGKASEISEGRVQATFYGYCEEL
ncbi:phage tail tube protein [Burkholderia cenocepacia]|uniref:phage tail tube protein n=1 Tax=Burkholderia cenocepacia TaxID=95486 RepID=UPI001B9F848A|nr:phage tail tube protein [Burkholderia cenocepacia]MBR8137186.1 phage tail tube protein [Burkholderia cenocepacia]